MYLHIKSKGTSFQAIELRAQAHIKLGNTDKAVEDLQSFIRVGTVKGNYNQHSMEAKRRTPEKVSGSSNTIGNYVDAKAEADSNQNYKKTKGHNMDLSKLERPGLHKTIDDTLKVDEMSSPKICPLKRPHASSNLNIEEMNKKLKSTTPQKYYDDLQKGRSSHARGTKLPKDSMNSMKLETHEGIKTVKKNASYKMTNVETSQKLGHRKSPKLRKRDQDHMTRKSITKLASKFMPSGAKCKAKRKCAPALRGILREEGQIMKAKEVRWKVPLDKIIWISRHRKLQESWEASFTEKISLSKAQGKR